MRRQAALLALITNNGLLTEGDFLSLSDSLVVQNATLYDTVTDASHKLHATAIPAIQGLVKGEYFDEWAAKNVRNGLTENDLSQILLFLNSIGGLTVKRPLNYIIISFIRQLRGLLVGVFPLRLSRRRDVTVKSLLYLTMVAMLPLITVVAILAVLSFGMEINSFKLAPSSLVFLTIIFISTAAHEYGHYYLLKYRRPLRLIQKGMRIGILHQEISGNDAKKIAIIGPVAGVLSAIYTSLLISFITYQSEYIYIGFLVAVFHLTSLLPNYGDGRAIWGRKKVTA